MEVYPLGSSVCDSIRNLAAVSAHECVTGAVDSFEMHRMRRVSVQFLPQLEHMVVHGPRTPAGGVHRANPKVRCPVPFGAIALLRVESSLGWVRVHRTLVTLAGS
jgi:hypothetical protein